MDAVEDVSDRSPGRWASGDVHSVYAAQHEQLRRLAFVLVGDLDLAADMVQDAFAALLRQQHLIEQPEQYLRRCVYNAAKTRYRWNAVRRRTALPIPDDAQPAQHDDVIDAIRRLPSRQRAAIVLRYYAHLTDPEVADTLDLPLGTAKSTLRRALETLRKELS
jgi:RNA polymerase sigma factor (sigma-70 family)